MTTCYEFAGFELLTSDWISAISTALLGAMATYLAFKTHQFAQEIEGRQQREREARKRAVLANILQSIRAAVGAGDRLTAKMKEGLADKDLSGFLAAGLVKQYIAVLREVDTGSGSLEFLDEAMTVSLGTLRGHLLMEVAGLELIAEHLRAIDDRILDQESCDAIEKHVAKTREELRPSEDLLHNTLVG